MLEKTGRLPKVLLAFLLIGLAAPVAEAGEGAPVGRTQSFWLHLNSTPVSDATIEIEAKRRAHIVLNAWEGDLLKKLKAVNPKVKVYVYKDLSSTRSYACKRGKDDEHLPAGLGYCDVRKNHPEWFLEDSRGNELSYSGYEGHWQMDIGNPEYRKAWVNNVVATSKSTGFDGVFVDNALYTCDAYHPGVCPAKYPDNASFQAAYKGMLAEMRCGFAAAGLLSVGNLTNARLQAGGWDAYGAYLDGAFDEWWLAFSSARLLEDYPEGWRRQVAEIAVNEANNKMTWVQPHFDAGDSKAFRYALASLFMTTSGHAAIAEIAKTDGYGDPTPWHPEYDWHLGHPVGAYRAVASKVFRRDFTCGLALVNANPTGSPAVKVPLHRAYQDHEGKTVTSVSLPGTTGVLLRANCPATPSGSLLPPELLPPDLLPPDLLPPQFPRP
ncbi:putative glycoside hydrolase family 15 protein [Lentzea californiensis]|uniref:putative glycoside hydrolase family 15 protein n=1 Tax=Lentzea californiensis TaxID=438851 RepID=UPI002165314F|nr:putative glycoside hydrolase family 15 protein [Lentzea californiensis]MCR3753949.1 putative glycosyl hydrolase family 15 [Lentzea californiensis]